MNNYDNLSKDELIKLLLEKDNLLEKKDIELRDLRIKYDKLILKYDNEHQRQIRDIYNQFVKKSEKLEPVDETINEAETKASKKPGQRQGNHNFMHDLKPTRTIIRELDEKDRICPSCGEVMVEIGSDSTKKIIKIPATYEVVEIVTKKYACKNKECDSTVRQALSDDVFGHSPVTPSFVADVINMKYNLAVPLDRYSKYLISKGINISTQCLSNYVLEAADILNPLYEKLKYELTHNKANVIHADETTLKVIDIADRQNCYMFVYTTTFFDNPVYIYEFSESRKTDKTEDLFKDYKGYLVCDKYAGYDKFKDKNIVTDRHIVSNYCWSGTEYNKDIYNLIIKKIGKPTITIILYAKPEAILARLKNRNIDDADIKKINLSEKAYERMIYFCETKKLRYEVIDTTSKTPEEIVSEILKIIEEIK